MDSSNKVIFKCFVKLFIFKHWEIFLIILFNIIYIWKMKSNLKKISNYWFNST